jgi:hypothetical protein
MYIFNYLKLISYSITSEQAFPLDMNSARGTGTRVLSKTQQHAAHPSQTPHKVSITPIHITKESTHKPLHIKSRRRLPSRKLRPAVGVSSPTIERSRVVDGIQVISKAYEDPRRRLSLPSPLMSSRPSNRNEIDNIPSRDLSTSVDETTSTNDPSALSRERIS